MPILNIEIDSELSSWPSSGTVAILDLEYTAWEGSAERGWAEPWEWREIIQIGMVLANGKNFSTERGVEILVRPERNQVLSDYFVALTGITQNRIDKEAVSFCEALDAIVPLAAEADSIIFNGCDGQILKENCAFNCVIEPWDDSLMFNFRPLLSASLGCDQDELTSSDLPKLAGINFEGQSHSALHDCRAIAAAFSFWRGLGLI